MKLPLPETAEDRARLVELVHPSQVDREIEQRTRKEGSGAGFRVELDRSTEGGPPPGPAEHRLDDALFSEGSRLTSRVADPFGGRDRGTGVLRGGPELRPHEEEAVGKALLELGSKGKVVAGLGETASEELDRSPTVSLVQLDRPSQVESTGPLWPGRDGGELLLEQRPRPPALPRLEGERCSLHRTPVAVVVAIVRRAPPGLLGQVGSGRQGAAGAGVPGRVLERRCDVWIRPLGA